MSKLVQIAQYVPTVENPEREQTLKQMLTWTGLVLLLYFTLTEIPLYAADAAQVEQAVQERQESNQESP
ncbi:hypothetical protein HRED_09772 [Candidatus Haloredivivus sp. G17]|nr:hypothetical protein HRED_09772 [Candidatus Haloredivivus sp. G17]